MKPKNERLNVLKDEDEEKKRKKEEKGKKSSKVQMLSIRKRLNVVRCER